MKKKSLTASVLLLFFMLSLPLYAAQQPDSLSIKIGQMLLIGFRGSTIGSASAIEADITERI